MPDSLDTLAERVREARCPECDYLVSDHADGQRPTSTARVMQGCALTEAEARTCYEMDELWKAEGWPAVIAAAESLGAAKERQRVRRAVENALPEDLFNGWSLSYVVENILATIDALP